ncbi:hypothetical protein JQV27_12070 [Sulfitobacter mediterraneus]|uniref:hypothetical protein n=1 Tax=Sulfitobacter mediterraneus TaxID=83219 RepID=UPI00193139D0|nr:hypothetical protein [Sulfitobacter mediterraneus]MBM1634115.1 hypothetical protein [Sulfitobacter mediterraneus]MBM1641370.1 hypothetical protein [Sulfitobacter mediterraneus]MBM1645980.1 hypothetical protein [Sulfitobacter mediterraneus]MBM1649489.1 hypothetical protein [Sulfitobacter mediterraneus]MBM1654048.1 hypothetical protein [Sulfitobacter mediterraneus]
MKINAAGLLLCTFLVGCGGTPPFNADETEDPTTTDGTIDSDRTLPPGTSSPQPDTTIFRKEAVDENGNGFAEGVAYNSTDDTFTVDNLPFDGGADTPYIRGQAVGSLGPYAVYEAVQQYPDTQTNATINQFRHRAIYGVSTSGNTEFAIVRTGAYVGYGFGGFVYERNGTVVLPTTGQALYNGQGAGLRDYNGRGGLEYTTSDVQIAIDFDDFNETTGRYEGAVDGFVFNRKVYNLAGEDITSEIYGRVGAASDATLTAIPTAVFTVSTNALDANGEITGTLTSRFGNNSGQAVDYENGQYYGIISGDGAEEIVGIIVLETGEDPTADGVRETLGFTIYRGNQ